MRSMKLQAIERLTNSVSTGFKITISPQSYKKNITQTKQNTTKL